MNRVEKKMFSNVCPCYFVYNGCKIRIKYLTSWEISCVPSWDGHGFLVLFCSHFFFLPLFDTCEGRATKVKKNKQKINTSDFIVMCTSKQKLYPYQKGMEMTLKTRLNYTSWSQTISGRHICTKFRFCSLQSLH